MAPGMGFLWPILSRGVLQIMTYLGSSSRKDLFTGAQPSLKAGTGLKMQTVRFFNVTLLGIYR